MLASLLKLIPADWEWKVAGKKVAYLLGKLAVAGLTYGKAAVLQQKLGIHIDPTTFEAGVTALVMSGIEALHDILKLHYPDAHWL